MARVNSQVLLEKLNHIHSDTQDLKLSLEKLNGQVRKNTIGREKQKDVNKLWATIGTALLGAVVALFKWK